MSRHLVGLIFVLTSPGLLAADAPKLALLVGCSEYDQKSINPLPGAANDVELWRHVLRTRFAFADGDITALKGPAARPTRAAIVREMDALVGKAEKSPGAVVFILLSGHGAQVPEDPAAGGVPEPDGLDEVFLPADTNMDANGALLNVIRDNEVGVWLDKFRAAGAHVCIVFDCCHSGTMTRGAQAREVSRTVALVDLCQTPSQKAGLAEQFRAARLRAGNAAPKDGPSVKTVVGIGRKPAKTAEEAGSVIAFYAAQPYEEAKELPRPKDAPDRPENRHGLLTFTLIEALEGQRKPDLTYRELERVLLARYAAERGVRPPIPFCEGDRDARVLGTDRLPPPADFILKRTLAGDLELDAGALRGLTPGTVLSVHPHPATNPADPKAVLGHVRVRTATPVTAIAQASDRNGRAPAKAPAPWPKLTRCEIVSADLGSLQVGLFLRSADPVLRAAADALAADVRGQIRVTATESEAEWILDRVTPAEAQTDYGKTVARDVVFLVLADGRAWGEMDPKAVREQQAAEMDRLRAAGLPPPKRVFAEYPADAAGLIRGLERDLPKVYRWQNLWRVTAALPGSVQVPTADRLEVRRAGKADWAVLTAGAPVHPGDMVQMTFTNASREPVWVTHVALDSSLGITVMERGGAIGANERWSVPIQIRPTAHGREGGMFLVVPQDDRPRPVLEFLKQMPLAESDRTRGDRSSAPNSPFGQLLQQAAWGGSGTRGTAVPDPTTDPTVFSETWTVRPIK